MQTTPTKQGHTPGKLLIRAHDAIKQCYELHIGQGYGRTTIAQAVKGDVNAARLAHCWNCHDELVEACKAALQCQIDGLDENTVDKLEAAIAKARGE